MEGRFPAVEAVDQVVQGHHPVRLDQQDRKDGPLPGRSDVHADAVRAHLERTEDLELHRGTPQRNVQQHGETLYLEMIAQPSSIPRASWTSRYTKASVEQGLVEDGVEAGPRGAQSSRAKHSPSLRKPTSSSTNATSSPMPSDLEIAPHMP